MDYQAASFYLSLVNSAGIIFIWFMQRGTVTTSAIDRLERTMEARNSDIREKLAHFESDLKNSPSHENLSQLYERMNDISKSVSQLAGTTSAMNEQVRTLISFLTQKGLER